jgi:hypothetical protein
VATYTASVTSGTCGQNSCEDTEEVTIPDALRAEPQSDNGGGVETADAEPFCLPVEEDTPPVATTTRKKSTARR